MITVEQIKEKVNAFPEKDSPEKLLNDIVLEFKIERGLEDFENGEFKDWDDFKSTIPAWFPSK